MPDKVVAAYFGVVRQLSWNHRPKFPRLANSGLCEVKSLATTNCKALEGQWGALGGNEKERPGSQARVE
jgi:hypothetical protein